MKHATEELLDQLKATFANDELAQYLNQFSEQFQALMQRGVMSQFQSGEFDTGPLENLRSEFATLMDPTALWQKLNESATLEPGRLFETQMQFMQQQSKLWQQTAMNMLGVAPDDEVIRPQRDDPRFRDAEWNDNPVYSHLKQAYLLNSKLLFDLLDNVSFKDEKSACQARFMVRQFANSLAPSNFIATNPEVCREIVASKGRNLYEGLQNFIADLKKSPDNALTISMADSRAFTLGDNIAMTPGEVVFRNELMELIQYTPQTETVHRTPTLIVPALINKYYIFDLSKKSSLVDWLVKQGLTVFVISWVNPDASLGHVRFEDYLLEGVVTAREVVTAITGEQDVNAIGYCIGGTLLASTQAWLTARQLPRFKSTTYFTTLLDFSDAGELSIYITEEFISGVEAHPQNQDVIDGRKIMLAFSLMRENNLYWSFFINNYLLGKDPAPFDLLYWNSDATNLPMATFSFYLRQMYLHNRLKNPGEVKLDGTPIDLAGVGEPAYVLATLGDHIAPWQGAYRSMQHYGGQRRFVLAGSGHIAGVMNPPAANKYGFWTNADVSAEPDVWLAAAQQHEGSWWRDWHDWIAPLAGEQVPARTPGSAEYPPLEPAPGRYVHLRAG